MNPEDKQEMQEAIARMTDPSATVLLITPEGQKVIEPLEKDRDHSDVFNADQLQAARKYLASAGGRARAQKMSPEARREQARKAAAARWAKGKQAMLAGTQNADKD